MHNNFENLNVVDKKESSMLLGVLVSFFTIVLVLLTILLIVHSIVYRPSSVQGPSMMNTLNPRSTYRTEHDIVYVNRFATINRFDIIVINDTIHVNEEIVKRVIGMPGDRILIAQNPDNYYTIQVKLNGEWLEEDYIFDTTIYFQSNNNGMQKTLNDFQNLRQNSNNPNHSNYRPYLFNSDGELVVPSSEVFVLGDNRGRSDDSAMYGTYPMSSIVGRVDFIIPFGTNILTYFLYRAFPFLNLGIVRL